MFFSYLDSLPCPRFSTDISRLLPDHLASGIWRINTVDFGVIGTGLLKQKFRGHRVLFPPLEVLL